MKAGEELILPFFSRHATRVRLELFDQPEDADSSRGNRSRSGAQPDRRCLARLGGGNRPGQLYAYRVDGPYLPGEGQRFNFTKLLLDPFATAISRLPTGTLRRLLATIRPPGAGPSPFESGRCRGHAEMRIHQRAFRLG